MSPALGQRGSTIETKYVVLRPKTQTVYTGQLSNLRAVLNGASPAGLAAVEILHKLVEISCRMGRRSSVAGGSGSG